MILSQASMKSLLKPARARMSSTKEYNQHYRQQHREYFIAYQRKYREEHKAELSVWHKEYYQKNRASSLAYNKERHKSLKMQVLNQYSITQYPSCAKCGIDDVDVLCIDHINGDGAAHRKHIKSGNHLYTWLITNNFPEGYQVLCHNCNWKKSLWEAEEKAEE